MAAKRSDVAELPAPPTVADGTPDAGEKRGPTGRPWREFPEPRPLRSHGPARIIALCNPVSFIS